MKRANQGFTPLEIERQRRSRLSRKCETRFLTGFSLIEVLIVIAVLGILTTLVLTGVKIAQNKAYDNSIRSSVGQLRLLAEQVYDSQGASYQDWTSDTTIQASFERLLQDIDENYGDTAGTPYVAVTRDTQVQDYCISAPMRAEVGKHYCIDATGVFQTVNAPCPDLAEDEDPLRCPAS